MSDTSPLRTAHEWVRERLRQEIITGAYAPGSPLKQTEVAISLGTSVTPVREAMRDLAMEGLIQVDPQRVARVRRIDAEDATEINEIRLLLEPLAARRAAERATAENIDSIHAAAVAADAADNDSDWLKTNYRFHLEVIESSQSPHLIGILTNLRQISTIYLGALVRASHQIRKKSSAEHFALVEAIAARNGDAAARIMHAHLAPSHQLAELDDASDARNSGSRKS